MGWQEDVVIASVVIVTGSFGTITIENGEISFSNNAGTITGTTAGIQIGGAPLILDSPILGAIDHRWTGRTP